MAERTLVAASASLMLIVGQRWSLAAVAALIDGPLRFGAMRGAIPRLSVNLLTRRLSELVDEGVVERVEPPPPAFVAAYFLTPWGAELALILAKLRRWASRRPREAGAAEAKKRYWSTLEAFP